MEEPLMAASRPVTALSRRRLFELGATSAGLAALLVACGDDEAPAPGRVGFAPEATEPPEAEVDDAVYLRTLTSLEYSIIEVYAALADLDGVDDSVAELLGRFSDDHAASADAFAELTGAAGGEPYECSNSWLMRRTLQPVIDNIAGATVDGTEIPPSDDPDRDTIATADALETLAAATAQQYVERIADPGLRAEVIRAGTAASRRAAVAALRANPAPAGYVSPLLTEGEDPVADEAGFMPQFAVPYRFGQLTPVALQVGAPDDAGQRFNTTLETPAENAYVYEGQTCPA
jgi:hypothetical protein